MATTDKGVETAKTTTVEERIDELRKRWKAALTPGGRDAAAKQHERGKLTAEGLAAAHGQEPPAPTSEGSRRERRRP